MTEVSVEQIRNFRLHSHHLDAAWTEGGGSDTTGIADVCTENLCTEEGQTANARLRTKISEAAGACGLQNSPPGAWETALFNRVPGCGLAEMEELLYGEKSLLQAWSFRGAPVVFPTSESAVFLSALLAEAEEPWIYTRGISLALDFLQLPFEEILELLKQVMPKLDSCKIDSKSALDQTLAEWMLPLLPAGKRELWNQPSMYGSPDRQTVGGAVVSFLLRPCALNGLVVFGERNAAGPVFTSYRNWMGHPLQADPDAQKKLVRKYLHCYGPATAAAFTSWLGCSGKQGRRLWEAVSQEIEPVTVSGKKAFILSADRERLFSPEPPQRELLLLGGHDPFLDQRDRMILQPDRALQKQIWKTVTNPGAILCRGEIIGIWTGRKKAKGMEIKMTLWKELHEERKFRRLAEEYAAFRQQQPVCIEISSG